jgi:hypothetical protein
LQENDANPEFLQQFFRFNRQFALWNFEDNGGVKSDQARHCVDPAN